MPGRTGRHSRGFSRGSPRRFTSWDLGPGGDDLPTLDRVAVSSSTAVIVGTGVTPVSSRVTVVRIRGHISFNLTAADVQKSGFNYVAAIGVTDLDGFTVGIGSLPQPFTNTDWPGWMWQASGSIRTSVGALAVGDPSINPVVIPIDTKAMRILRQNEVLFMAVDVGESGTATMDISAYTRTLLKLT